MVNKNPDRTIMSHVRLFILFIECHLFDIGPFEFNISRCKVRQWCEDFRSLDPHVVIVVDHSEELS